MEVEVVVTVVVVVFEKVVGLQSCESSSNFQKSRWLGRCLKKGLAALLAALNERLIPSHEVGV